MLLLVRERSPPFGVCTFIGASGWPECLGCAYRCFRRRSGLGGDVRGWLSATRHPQYGMRSFGTVLVRMLEPVFSVSVGFCKVPDSVFCFCVNFVASHDPMSCGKRERSARAEIRDTRVRRY